HLALASDVKGRPGLVQLGHLLGQLLTAGVPVRLDRLFRGRDLRPFDLAALGQQTGKPALTPSTWMVNSIRNRPLNAPEPRLLGQTRAGEEDRVTRRQGDKVTEAPQRLGPAPATPPPPAAPFSPGVNGAAPHPAALPTVPADEAAQVMLRFQDLMARFLDTQRSVMTSYLQGGGVPALNGAAA